jgi:hypothetical protein
LQREFQFGDSRGGKWQSRKTGQKCVNGSSRKHLRAVGPCATQMALPASDKASGGT